VLRIGGDARPETQFAAGVQTVRMPTGEIVVASHRARELLLFSPSGAYLRHLGRPGGGPGEFESPFLRLTRVADTVFVLETPPGKSQVHAFTVGRGFAHRTPISATGAGLNGAPLARTSSGAILASVGGWRIISNFTPGAVIHDTANLVLITSGDSSRAVALGRFESTLRFGYALASSPGRTGIATYTLGPALVTGASGDRVWIGDSGTGQIRILSATGESLATITVPVPQRAFSRAALDAARRDALAAAANDDERAMYEVLYLRSLLPRTAPVFTRFVSGIEGEVWVELFDENQAAPKRFVVLDRDGRLRARVSLPTNARVEDVGRDFVLGVLTDGNGEEFVVQYRLERGGGR